MSKSYNLTNFSHWNRNFGILFEVPWMFFQHALASFPQITHWHSPYFHGYFAAGNSFPSILGDMLSDAIGCIGFSWVCYKH